MSNRLRSVLSLLTVLAASSEAWTQDLLSPGAPTLEVSGTGQVRVPADQASVLIAVESRAPVAADAGGANARTMAAVREALLRSGIPASAITTAGYSIQPNMRYIREGPEQDGYVASNMLRVTTPRLEQVGAILDAALAAGATRINALEFTASNTVEARRRALAEAITQARSDAMAMAEAAGGALGPLLSLSTAYRSEQIAAIRPRDGGGPAMAPPPTPLSPGEIVVGASVTGRWQFVPRE